MKTKKINVGRITGLNSYELAVQAGEFNGTLEEYIQKEQDTYNNMIRFANSIKADMESLIASSSNKYQAEEVVQARSTYKTLAARLAATDDEINTIINRLNQLVDNDSSIVVTCSGKNIEMRNNGLCIQWKYVGFTEWTDLIELDALTPILQIGDVSFVNPDEAKVTMTGTVKNPTLNFCLPKAKDGVDGGAIINIRRNPNGDVIATVKNPTADEEIGEDESRKYIIPVFSIGKVETLNEDENAYVTIEGTPSNPILNFGIPRGKSTELTNAYVGKDGLMKFQYK